MRSSRPVARRVSTLNVTDGEAAARVVEQVVAELGGIHVLVNNAGITDDRS